MISYPLLIRLSEFSCLSSPQKIQDGNLAAHEDILMRYRDTCSETR